MTVLFEIIAEIILTWFTGVNEQSSKLVRIIAVILLTVFEFAVLVLLDVLRQQASVLSSLGASFVVILEVLSVIMYIYTAYKLFKKEIKKTLR